MRYLALFAAIIATTPLAIDMYLPAIVQLADFFNAPITQVQNSLSIYLAGYAFGMFLFGPMADRVGRRPLVLAGLTGFIIFSLSLSFCQNIELFLILRFLQAMCGGAATVVIPGAIRQLLGKDTAKGLSYVSMIMMLAPMVAPAIGGLLLTWKPWPIIFHVISFYAISMLVITYFYFPKLEMEASRTAVQQSFIKRYTTVIGDKYCHAYLVITMLASFVFFTYITSVSFIYMELFQFSETQFSLLFGLNVTGLMTANLLNTRLVPKLGSRKILQVAAPLAMTLGILFLLAILFTTSKFLIIGLLIPLLGTLIIISANADALILRRFTEHGGTAAAVIGSLRFGSGALAGPVLALTFNGSALPVGIIFAISLSFLGLAFSMTQKPNLVDYAENYNH